MFQWAKKIRETSSKSVPLELRPSWGCGSFGPRNNLIWEENSP